MKGLLVTEWSRTEPPVSAANAFFLRAVTTQDGKTRSSSLTWAFCRGSFTVGLILLAIPMILRQAWSRELGILFIIAAALNIVSFFVSGPSGSSALVTILGVLSQAIAFAGLAWWGWSAWSLQGAESATTTVAAE